MPLFGCESVKLRTDNKQERRWNNAHKSISIKSIALNFAAFYAKDDILKRKYESDDFGFWYYVAFVFVHTVTYRMLIVLSWLLADWFLVEWRRQQLLLLRRQTHKIQEEKPHEKEISLSLFRLVSGLFISRIIQRS